jgi:hypothetical protein
MIIGEIEGLKMAPCTAILQNINLYSVLKTFVSLRAGEGFSVLKIQIKTRGIAS